MADRKTQHITFEQSDASVSNIYIAAEGNLEGTRNTHKFIDGEFDRAADLEIQVVIQAFKTTYRAVSGQVAPVQLSPGRLRYRLRQVQQQVQAGGRRNPIEPYKAHATNRSRQARPDLRIGRQVRIRIHILADDRQI